MSSITICQSIRKVRGGYIVAARYPFGPDMPCGEVVCKTWKEVIEILSKAEEGIDV